VTGAIAGDAAMVIEILSEAVRDQRALRQRLSIEAVFALEDLTGRGFDLELCGYDSRSRSYRRPYLNSSDLRQAPERPLTN
jgi:hypothetical protein